MDLYSSSRAYGTAFDAGELFQQQVPVTEQLGHSYARVQPGSAAEYSIASDSPQQLTFWLVRRSFRHSCLLRPQQS